MSIKVYWGCNEKEWLRAKAPEPVYKNFIKNIKDKNTQLEICPSVKNYFNNTFSVSSIYDYNFKIKSEKNEVFSNLYDQNFFNEHVIVRSNEDRLFSFSQQYVFFTEEKSLEMSASIFPYLENNDITKRCISIPGTVDIGKWFRIMDFAFYLKKEYDEFQISQDEIYQYIKFNTDKKIIFKQFMFTEKIKKYSLDIIHAKESRKTKTRSLNDYYLMLKHKKHIIKEINNNLI